MKQELQASSDLKVLQPRAGSEQAAQLHPTGVLTCTGPSEGTGGLAQQICLDAVLPRQVASQKICAMARHIHEVPSSMLLGFDRKKNPFAK